MIVGAIPLSPMDPPRLPEEGAAQYFSPPASPLPPVALANNPVAQGINRVVDGENGATRLETVMGERKYAVRYDSQHDAFILDSEAGKKLPTFYQFTDQSNGLVEIRDINRRLDEVTDQMRMDTLRA